MARDGDKTQQAETVTKDFYEFQNVKDGYTVNVPRGWTAKQQHLCRMFVFAPSSQTLAKDQNPRAFISVDYRNGQFPSDVSIDNGIHNLSNFGKIESRTVTNEGSIKVIRVHFLLTTRGFLKGKNVPLELEQPEKLLLEIRQYTDRYFSIYCKDRASDFEKTAPVFEQIIKSFSIIDGKSSK